MFPGFACTKVLVSFLRSPEAVAVRKRTLRLLHLDVFRRFLALVSDELVFDYCALIERAQARPLHGGYMHEYIFAPALRLHEAISLSRVEPLHGTCCHNHSPLFSLRPPSYGRALTPDTALNRKKVAALVMIAAASRHHAASVRTPLARMLPRVMGAGDPGPLSALVQ
jgi:hypothetical protein